MSLVAKSREVVKSPSREIDFTTSRSHDFTRVLIEARNLSIAFGGIRAVGLQAPLGTHTGWSLRAAGFMEDAPCYLNGFFVPFAATAAERLAAGDPRLSLEERYGSQEAYVAAATAAARDLVAQRLLLPEDADRLVAAARAQDLGLGAVAAAAR